MTFSYFKDGEWRLPGGLISVKYAIKTDTQVESAVAAGSNVAVSGLSISHAVTNAANRVILIATLNATQDGTRSSNPVLAADATLIGVASASGNRRPVGSSSNVGLDAHIANSTVIVVHTPGSTSAVSYTVRAVNVRASAASIYINRSLDNVDDGGRALTASSLTLMEVSV